MYGSFLNVVIYRWPREQSVVTPRSRCPHCRVPIAWYDNLPVLSWLILLGRGRCCRQPISVRYPLVEAACGALAAGLWLRWTGSAAFAGASALACGSLLAVALIDWDTFLIPDELSLGLALGGLCCSWFNPYFKSEAGAWWLPVWWSLRGAALGFSLGWAVAAAGEAAFKKEALGGGDVKLLAGVGAWTGATGVFDCMMIGSLLGSIYGVGMMRAGKLGRGDPMPFGPFLSVGAIFNFFHLLPMGWPLV